MRNLLALFLALILTTGLTQAQITKSQVNTVIETNMPDNIYGRITPIKIRAITKKLNDFAAQADSLARAGGGGSGLGYTPENASNKVLNLTNPNNTTYLTSLGVSTALGLKVDKVTGKVLSSNDYTDVEKVKLAGIATGATVNSSDALLRDRSTHNGVQLAATISDFSTAVSSNTAVAANTAKVTNATHTGQVTGSTALTIAAATVTNANLANVATATFKGRNAAGTGTVEDLSIAQAQTMIGFATKADTSALSAVANSRTPVITSTQLRAWTAYPRPAVVILNDKQGAIFLYNPANTTSLDDSVLVVRQGDRRYERVYDYIRPEMWGANPNDLVSDQAALSKAAATGQEIRLRKGRYIGNITIEKQKLSGSGYSSGWAADPGQDAPTVIQGTVTVLSHATLENLNVEKSPSDGIVVLGYTTTIRNVGSHLNAGHGIHYAGDDAHNLNHWRLDGFYSTYNQKWGVFVDNATADPSLPNANAGYATNLDIRGNGTIGPGYGGIYINRAIDNNWDGISSESNFGPGIRIGPYGKGNFFQSPYTEDNTAEEILLDSASSRNTIWAYRSGIANDEVIDNGTNNIVFGSVYNTPRVRKLSFGEVEFMDFDEGRYSIKKTDQKLKIALNNTALSGKVLFQTAGAGVVGIGTVEGGNNALLTNLANITYNVAFGSVSAGSTTSVDVPFAEVCCADYMLTAQPTSAVLASGLILQVVWKSDGIVTARMTNITASTITPGNVELMIHALRVVKY